MQRNITTKSQCYRATEQKSHRATTPQSHRAYRAIEPQRKTRHSHRLGAAKLQTKRDQQRRMEIERQRDRVL